MNIYIPRAGSGAGKSTWAKKLHPSALIISADDFYMKNGFYDFKPELLGEAHAQCLRHFIEACQDPVDSEVVVDNTNATIAEFAPYVQVGIAYGHQVTIVTFDYDPVIAHARNTHGVPFNACIGQYDRLVENTKLIPPWWVNETYNAR